MDPRGKEVNENLISDKARAVAGGVLEAILYLRSKNFSQTAVTKNQQKENT